MITKLPAEELISFGSRYRIGYLVTQAGYTLGVAAEEGEPLEALLPNGYLTEVTQLLTDVQKSGEDKALVSTEAKDATVEQNESFAAGKVWRRKVARRAMRAVRMGETVPASLLTYSSARTLPALVIQVSEMVKLLEASGDSLHDSGRDALIAEGKSILDGIKTADATQEQKRLKELPDSVRRFYEAKGRLYVGLKVINDAGRELHADNAQAASRYNLAILHRRGGRRALAKQPS